jgi:hypothetical protein
MKISVKSISLKVFILFGLSVFSLQSQDKFAQIGKLKQGVKQNVLYEPGPGVLPDIFLPVEHNRSSAFTALKTMSSKEELNAELKKRRAMYEPFLKNIAPVLPSMRQQLFLSEFQWREQTPADILNFISVLQGEGDWQTVKIPHYAPPLGRATTFYYKEIEIPRNMLNSEALFICFKGVDYKASVFVNGSYLGSHEGFFAPFEFNISKVAKAGRNTILIKVENDYSTLGSKDYKGYEERGDKIYGATGPGYDEPILGWHHCPPAMGIAQECFLESRSNLHINDVFVRTIPSENRLEAWMEINNFFETYKKIKLSIAVYGQNFADTLIRPFEYEPFTTNIPGVGDLDKPDDNKRIPLNMGYGVNLLRIPIEIKDFMLWQQDSPYLYQIQIKIIDENGKETDNAFKQVGIREFRMDTISIPKGRMYLNGEQIRLRGANTMGSFQQCVMKKDWDQLIDDILLAKICNMNYIRFTQSPVQDEVYDYFDRLGMLNQTDLPLFGGLRVNKFAEAGKQAGEMERLVRSHPSAIMVTFINERFPNAQGFPQRNIGTAEEYYKLFNALDQNVLYANPDRVIKAGDGDYDPPSPGLPDNHCYNTWYNGHGLEFGKLYKGYWQPVKPDWLYACGEFGAEGLDPLNTMQKYYPKEWLPKDSEDEKSWTASRISMSQTQRFHYLWYNTQYSLNDWIEASQNHQAWAMKLMTEAFRRDSRMVSFAIHLYIDAWPAGWMKAVMDVDRQPKKAFFAYRNSLEPLMLSLRCDRWSFFSGENIPVEAWVCNDFNENKEGFKLSYQLENNGKIIFANQTNASIPANDSRFQGFIRFPAPKVTERTRFTVRAALSDKSGKSIHQNVFEFDVFPSLKSEKQTIYCVENTNSESQAVIAEMEWSKTQNLNDAKIALFDNDSLYQTDPKKWDSWVSSGGKLVFLNLNPGEHIIGGKKALIEPTEMGKYLFVSPQTGHNIVKDCKPFDFFCWFEVNTGMIKPILFNTILAPEWKAILVSGKVNWSGDSDAAMAVSELASGEGYYRICNLELAGRIVGNPSARIFAGRLIKS